MYAEGCVFDTVLLYTMRTQGVMFLSSDLETQHDVPASTLWSRTTTDKYPFLWSSGRIGFHSTSALQRAAAKASPVDCGFAALGVEGPN